MSDNMLDILKNFDAAEKGDTVATTSADKNGMKSILESFNRVSEAPMPVPAPAPMPQEPQGQPVSMNVSLNASGKDHVDDLLKLMQNAGLSGAGQVGQADTKLDVDIDGDNQPDIALQPKEESLEESESSAAEFLKYLKQDPSYFPGADIEKTDDGTVKILASNGEEVAEVDVKTGDIYLANGDDYNIADEENAEQTLQTMYAEINGDMEEGYANSPTGSPDEEEYKDTEYMTKDLSGGLNREKKMYAKAQDGDNAMAIESIKDILYKALAEKMDPVGKEDGDVNNDGEEDSSDEYIMKRRAAIAKSKAKKK